MNGISCFGWAARLTGQSRDASIQALAQVGAGGDDGRTEGQQRDNRVGVDTREAQRHRRSDEHGGQQQGSHKRPTRGRVC